MLVVVGTSLLSGTEPDLLCFDFGCDADRDLDLFSFCFCFFAFFSLRFCAFRSRRSAFSCSFVICSMFSGVLCSLLLRIVVRRAAHDRGRFLMVSVLGSTSDTFTFGCTMPNLLLTGFAITASFSGFIVPGAGFPLATTVFSLSAAGFPFSAPGLSFPATGFPLPVSGFSLSTVGLGRLLAAFGCGFLANG